MYENLMILNFSIFYIKIIERFKNVGEYKMIDFNIKHIKTEECVRKMPYPCDNIKYKIEIVEIESKEPPFLSKQISINSRDRLVTIVEKVVKAINELDYKSRQFDNYNGVHIKQLINEVLRENKLIEK